jgi:hypothetical protein
MYICILVAYPTHEECISQLCLEQVPGSIYSLVAKWTAEGTAAQQDTENHQLALGSTGRKKNPFKNLTLWLEAA